MPAHFSLKVLCLIDAGLQVKVGARGGILFRALMTRSAILLICIARM